MTIFFKPIVQMRAGRKPGGAHMPDYLALVNLMSLLDMFGKTREMIIIRSVPILMLNQDLFSIEMVLIPVNNNSVSYCPYRRSVRGGKINAQMWFYTAK